MEYKKLDYSLKTSAERIEFLDTLPEEQINNPKNAELYADYIISALTPEEKKEKKILTDNRMVTINKRETSYQGLVSQFENGEDGIWNITINDKNVLLTPKISITAEDLAEIEPLQDLKNSIKLVEEMMVRATGRRKFALKKQLIEMHQEQYTIKNHYKQPTTSSNLTRVMTKLDLSDHYAVAPNEDPVNAGMISFFDELHISALLCNYSLLKQDSMDRFESDMYYLLLDFDAAIDNALAADYPLYLSIVIHKIDGRTNAEIQQLIKEEHGILYTVEYISSLWRNKIPKLIAESEKEKYLTWYYQSTGEGRWKKCSRCGQTKLAHNKFFSKNATSKDGLYSICKKCRNAKKGE